jgi:hypothetical protein
MKTSNIKKTYINKILGTLAIALLSDYLSSAQISNSQLSTNWGIPLYGVQLSIGTTNTNLTIDSTNTILVRIKNVSTNNIYIAGIDLIRTTLVLTNNFGRTYRLTPDILHSGRYISIPSNYFPYTQKLDAGTIFEDQLPIVIGKDIQTGDYDLKCVQHFAIAKEGDVYRVESNYLKVQIK